MLFCDQRELVLSSSEKECSEDSRPQFSRPKFIKVGSNFQQQEIQVSPILPYCFQLQIVPVWRTSTLPLCAVQGYGSSNLSKDYTPTFAPAPCSPHLQPPLHLAGKIHSTTRGDTHEPHMTIAFNDMDPHFHNAPTVSGDLRME